MSSKTGKRIRLARLIEAETNTCLICAIDHGMTSPRFLPGLYDTASRLTPPFDEAQVRFAFLHAPLIRRRLTLGDLLLFFGMGREALWRKLWSTWGLEPGSVLPGA